MSTFLRFLAMDIKLFFRDTQATFFAYIFNILLLVIMCAIFDNMPNTGTPFVDIFLPNLVAMSILAFALFTLGAQTVVNREQGIFRRYLATPLHPGTIIGSAVAQGAVLLLISILLNTTIAVIFYDAKVPSNVLGITGAVLISMISFFAFALALFSFVKTSKAAFAVSSALLNVMMFLSGVIFPKELLPTFLQYVTYIIPLKYVAEFISSVWSGGSYADNLLNISVLAGIFVASLVIAIRNFKWE